MPERTDHQATEPTPVDEDMQATAPQLLDRAATDYATGWGCPDVRATGDTGSTA